MPSCLSTKRTPAGSFPLSLSVAVGKPVVATVKLPAEPIVKLAAFTLVMIGG